MAVSVHNGVMRVCIGFSGLTQPGEKLTLLWTVILIHSDLLIFDYCAFVDSDTENTVKTCRV